jgi:hypothetical protein
VISPARETSVLAESRRLPGGSNRTWGVGFGDEGLLCRIYGVGFRV